MDPVACKKLKSPPCMKERRTVCLRGSERVIWILSKTKWLCSLMCRTNCTVQTLSKVPACGCPVKPVQRLGRLPRTSKSTRLSRLSRCFWVEEIGSSVWAGGTAWSVSTMQTRHKRRSFTKKQETLKYLNIRKVKRLTDGEQAVGDKQIIGFSAWAWYGN